MKMFKPEDRWVSPQIFGEFTQLSPFPHKNSFISFVSNGLLDCPYPSTTRSHVPPDYPFQRVFEYPKEEDAFKTIMKWLQSKIKATR
jgi:hypothetical protein